MWISAEVNINSLERDGLHQAELCHRHTMINSMNNTLKLDWSQPGITMTVPTIGPWDVGDKMKTIRGRENVSAGTWNVRHLRPTAKLEELQLMQ